MHSQLIRIVCFPKDVFSALLFSVFSVAIPVVPASSITTGAAIATCFAPEENCNAFAVDAVNGAEREILVSAYSLTTGSGIPEALARAAQRGVDVRLIADRTTPCGRNAGVDMIVRAGASAWIDGGVRIAHAKAMVIDGKVTLVGSMNWSKGAALNSENLGKRRRRFACRQRHQRPGHEKRAGGANQPNTAIPARFTLSIVVHNRLTNGMCVIAECG
jgi:hypothetical protein